MFESINKVKGDSVFVKTLSREGLITKKELNTLRKKSKNDERFFSEVFFESSPHPKEKILEIFSKHYELPKVDLKKKKISPFVISLIPAEISQQHNVVIFKKIGEIIHVAMVSPENSQIVDFIEKKTGLKIVKFVTSPDDIRHALSKKNKISSSSDDLLRMIDLNIEGDHSRDLSPEKMADMVPVIKLVNSLIERAVTSNASDIHIQPMEKTVVVRYRIDGILNKIAEFPKNISQAMVARIKIMSDIKIDEHMAPQDGRFQHDVNGQKIAFRVSVIPTLNGPKVALRVLEMKEKMLTLRRLGLNKNDFKTIKNEISSPHGIILATGPTGAGKTTTLYTLLQMLNKDGVNICTVEDPIEYGIENINQMQIKPSAGLTFASGLKALLRQDPNILMIGEIRDSETAGISINSAMTGHLVLSTIHTNNAFLVPQRLIEMGMQQYLTGTVLNMMIGQRLVRKLCPHCKSKTRKPEALIESHQMFIDIESSIKKLKKVGLVNSNIKIDDLKLYKSRGCKKCSNTGYKGRMGIYEVLKVSEAMRRVIIMDGGEQAVKKQADKENVLRMADDGILKVINGTTTFEEIIRVTKE